MLATQLNNVGGDRRFPASRHCAPLWYRSASLSLSFCPPPRHLCARPLAQLIENESVGTGTIVRLTEYICNQVSGRKIIICLNLEPLGKGTAPAAAPAAAAAQPYSAPAAAPAARHYQGSGAVVRNAQGGGGGGGGGAGQPRLTPIRGLNPYQNRWTIKARVTDRGTIRTWDKGPTNQGKLISVTLLDSEGKEIRATFFREAVDKFEPMMQASRVSPREV